MNEHEQLKTVNLQLELFEWDASCILTLARHKANMCLQEMKNDSRCNETYIQAFKSVRDDIDYILSL